jgi:hypothetical protein
MLRTPPPVNPNAHDIADRAKYAYFAATKVLADVQYRLAELAGTGQMDPKESKSLQQQMVSIWEDLYFGTLCAVRDLDSDDRTWDEADNTYSDGREVMVQVRIEPEVSLSNWEHIKLAVGDGAVNVYRRGTVSYISPIWGEDQHGSVDPPEPLTPDDLLALRERLRLDGSDDFDVARTNDDDTTSD